MPQRYNAPDFEGIVKNFLEPYMAMKQGKRQDLQDEFARTMDEKRYDEEQKYREWMRQETERANRFKEAESMRPKIEGGQQTGYGFITPGELPTTGPYREEEYNPQFTPIPELQQKKGPSGFELSAGQSRFEYDPATKTFKSVASLPGNTPSTGQYTRGQAWDDAYRTLTEDAPTTFNSQTGEFSMGGKVSPSLKRIQPTADSLYNMQNYGQFAPPGAIQKEDPEISMAKAKLASGEWDQAKFDAWLKQWQEQ